MKQEENLKLADNSNRKFLKILFLSHKFYPEVGGIEVNSEIIASEFHKNGHQVRLLTWTGECGEKTFPFSVIRKPNIKQLIYEHNWADVVFENNPCLRLVWPAVFFKKPSVVALRTWINRMDGSLGWQDKLKFSWLGRASAVIAVSEAVKKRNWPKAIVIGNPYRINLFKQLPEVPRNSDFVFLGRLVSDKGADLAIRAFQKICNFYQRKEGSKFSLTIVGDGPERKILESLVISLGISDKVIFTGSLRGQSLVTCLNRHKYLLVPSVWEEPFGNVALEGMACGCLPIVSDGGGLPDAVGNAGLKFRRGDVDSLVNCIKSLMDDLDLEQKLRKNAEAHLAVHHPELVAKRYLNVIQAAVSKK